MGCLGIALGAVLIGSGLLISGLSFSLWGDDGSVGEMGLTWTVLYFLGMLAFGVGMIVGGALLIRACARVIGSPPGGPRGNCFNHRPWEQYTNVGMVVRACPNCGRK